MNNYRSVPIKKEGPKKDPANLSPTERMTQRVNEYSVHKEREIPKLTQKVLKSSQDEQDAC